MLYWGEIWLHAKEIPNVITAQQASLKSGSTGECVSPVLLNPEIPQKT